MQKKNKTPTVLLILDGWGCSEQQENNAIKNANTPIWDGLIANHPNTLINASGLMVGLPKTQMGNSEVGHINIGSGRVVYQELTRIDTSIEDNSFYDNAVLCSIVDKAVSKNKAVHIMGLLSAGGVHSHQSHIHEMVKLASQRGAQQIYIHAFLDGRDTPPRSAAGSIQDMENLLDEVGVGCIASITGRYYAMDRDNRWDRVEKAYDVIINGHSNFESTSALEALESAYSRNENDEFVKATAILNNGNKVAVNDGDSIIFMNFRADRARQISHAFTDDNFSGFVRKSKPLVQFATLTKYSNDIIAPAAYSPEGLTNILAEVLEQNSLTQLRIAETEKYAHVTFFFNGGREEPFIGEDRILVPSPDVATYDLKPEMSAYEVTDKLTSSIKSAKYDTIICNYANADMVGHTGKYDAAIKAVEALDSCLAKVVQAVNEVDGNLFITADHGNADQMVDPVSGKVHTAHTINPVPFVYIGPYSAIVEEENGKLSDIAPTILSVMGIDKPIQMTGKQIFKFKNTEVNND